MRRRLTWGLALLRITGCTALLLLLWNPIASRLLPATTAPLVLLDASLSMAGHGGRWGEALDSARSLARGGVIWRFGARVAAFDSAPPSDGASRLAPALAAAAARGGAVAVVTDGSVTDVSEVAPDLLHRLRIVVLARTDFRDAFIATVEGPHRIAATDTVRLTVTYGVEGTGDGGRGKGKAALVVSVEGRRLVSRDVSLPDSGIVSTELTIPASRLPSGWSALDVRLQGATDAEPRDDARLFVVEVNPTPSVVVLASPPDWDLRFLARTLADVARVPVTVFVQTEPGHPVGGGWRDASTLAPASLEKVKRALAGARLVVEGGDPAGFGRVSAPAGGARLEWPTGGGLGGEWYVDPPPPSPLAAGLGGLAWDSLPPVVGVTPTPPDSASIVALTARLARQGRPRPIMRLSERGASRRAEIAAVGLYRWAVRGGASAEVYRALVAELANWLLGEGGRGKGERAMPAAAAVANGLPVVWRWTGAGTPQDLSLTLSTSKGERRDTLRFDATGQATLQLPPAIYHYAVDGGRERGVVAVETYSDEWRPNAPALRPQPGAPAARIESVGMRGRWWLFVLAIAAFTMEWAWRRRLGLP